MTGPRFDFSALGGGRTLPSSPVRPGASFDFSALTKYDADVDNELADEDILDSYKNFFWNYPKALGEEIAKDPRKAGENLLENISAAPSIIASKAAKTFNYLADRGITGTVSDLGKGFEFMGEGGGGIFGAGKGLLKLPITLAEAPVETLTGIKRGPGGTAKPATPEEYAQSVQNTTGIIIGLGAGKVASEAAASALGVAMKPTIAQAQQIATRGIAGNLARSFAAEATASGILGAGSAAVSGLGQEEDYVANIANSALSLPAVTLGGMFGIRRGFGASAAAQRQIDLYRSNQLVDAYELAIAQDININPKSTPDEIAANLEGFASADDLAEAAIRSRIGLGLGYTLPEGLNPESLNKVLKKLKIENPDINLDEAKLGELPFVKNRPARYGPDTVEFESPLDKLAYWAQSAIKKQSKTLSNIQAIAESFGLDMDGLVNHGKAVKAALKDAKLQARNPAEIEARTAEQAARGQKVLENSIDNQVFRDVNGKTWVRRGDTVMEQLGPEAAQNGQVPVTYPINDPTIAAILGQTSADIAALSNYRQLPKQKFDPNFGKPGDLQVLNGPNGKIHIAPATHPDGTPFRYTERAKKVFEQTGFFPGEVAELTRTYYDGNSSTELVKVVDYSHKTSDGQYVTIAVQSPLYPTDSLEYRTVNVKDLSSLPSASLIPQSVEFPDSYVGFHGTRSEFDNLDIDKSSHFGVHFGSTSAANRIIDSPYGLTKSNGPPRIIRAKVNIKNPLRVPDLESWNPQQLMDTILQNLTDAGHITDTEAAKIRSDFLSLKDVVTPENPVTPRQRLYKVIPDLLEKYGYDGLIYENQYEGGGDSLIAIRNNQIEETWSPAGKETFKSVPQLTAPGYLQSLYTNFVNSLDLDAVQSESFGGKLVNFLQKAGLKYTDIDVATQWIYKKLQEDVVKLMDPADIALFEGAQKALSEFYTQRSKDYYTAINDLVDNKGMWYENDGAGGYKIYDKATSTLLTKVNSMEEVGAYVGATRSQVGLPLDGGPAGQIDPAVGGMGKLPPTVTRFLDNGWREFWDNRRTSGFFGRYFTPVYDRFIAYSNRTVKDGTGAAFADTITKGYSRLHGWIENNIKGEVEQVNALNREVKDAASAERISNWLSAQSLSDILKDANPLEFKMAQEIAALKAPIEKVKQLMFNRRMVAAGKMDPADFQEFAKTLNSNVVKAADLLESSVSNPETATYKIVNMVDALEFPASTLGRKDYALKSGMTPAEVAIAQKYEALYNRLAKLADIPPDKFIKYYLPTVRRYSDLVDNNWLKASGEAETRFVNELTKLGITPAEMRQLDVREITRRYTLGLAKSRSGFNETMNNARKMLTDWAERTKQTEGSELAQVIYDEGNEWIDSAMGYRRSEGDVTGFVMKLFGKEAKFDVGSLMHGISVAKLGFRPSMLALDIASAAQMVGGSFGHQFLKDVMFKSIPDGYIQQLMKSGDIPPTVGNAIVGMSPEYFNTDVMTKLSDAGQVVSGQQWWYGKLLAGVFRETEVRSLKATTDFKDMATTRKKLGDLLSIHNNDVQKLYEKYVLSGQYEVAAKYLARVNSGRMANRYGEVFNPLGWQKNTLGRMYGQFGSWAANATSWGLDTYSNGTPREIAKRAVRTNAYGAAVYTAMTAAGFDPARMLVNPIMTLPVGGPVITTVLPALSQVQNLASPDERRRGYAIEELKMKLGGVVSPAVINNIIRADRLSREGYSPVQVGGQAIGLPVNRDAY